MPAFLVHTDQVHFLKKYITYSDSGVSAGTLEIGRLPKNSLILATHVQVATVSTAGGALTVGTTSGTANSIVTSGDINETVAAVTRVAGVGVLSSTADLPVYVKLSGATAGAAYVAIEYIPFPPNS
jgi:hypothetical protein